MLEIDVYLWRIRKHGVKSKLNNAKEEQLTDIVFGGEKKPPIRYR
jgi:hypothetical protein